MLCAGLGVVAISCDAMFTSDSKDFSMPQNDLLVEPNLGVEFVNSRRLLLPPRFRLHAVGQSAGSILEWDSTHQAPVAVGPVCVRHEQTQHWAAEELAACADLRCDRKLS